MLRVDLAGRNDKNVFLVIPSSLGQDYSAHAAKGSGNTFFFLRKKVAKWLCYTVLGVSKTASW